MQLRLVACLLYSLYNNFTDWREHKVYNWAFALFALAGVVINTLSGGIKGLAASLGGGAFMLLLFPLFVLRMLGAGDVKALIAIGCMLSISLAPTALLSSIFGGGLLAIFVILFRKNGKKRFNYFLTYLKSCILTMSIQPYTMQLDSDGVFRFTFGITIGIVSMIIHILIKN